MNKKHLILLVVIFCFAYFLRVMYLPQKALTFGYDQARDHIQARNIINGDLKIQGPSASTPGMHHGVFWFYYLVPPSLISDGNPITSAYWNSLFNALVVFVVFALTFKMTKSKLASFVASLFFAVSFEATQYATWLSNPTIASWTVPLTYLGLWMWIKEKNRWAPIITGLALGLSVQANIFLMYQGVPVLLWLFIMKKDVDKRSVIKFIISGFVAVSTIVLSEAKFGFKIFAGLASVASSQDAVIASKKFGDFIVLFFNQIGNVYAFNSYPGNVAYGGALVLILIVVSIVGWIKNLPSSQKHSLQWQPFLATWLLSHVTVASLGGASTPFLLVGIGPAVSILLGIYVAKWWDGKNKVPAILLFAILIFGNISMIRKENPKGQTIFAIQKDMLLSKQLEAIDYTYQSANGRMFSTNSLTSPLEVNIVWSFLYHWYGVNKYGYDPEWHGGDQSGQLDKLRYIDPNTNDAYLIIEPLSGIPAKYLQMKIDEEDLKSQFLEERNWGELRVQKRTLIVNKHN